MLHSLRGRLWLLLTALLLLVIGSVTVTFVAVTDLRDDARLINLAGRQRMLSQQMTWLALTAPQDPALAAARARFAQTLTALRDGGPAPDAEGQSVTVPRIADPPAQAELADAWGAWARFEQELDRVAAGEAVDSTALTAASLTLLDTLDRVVARLTATAQAKARRQQVAQTIFLLATLGLLGWGYQVTRARVVSPLTALGGVAQRMAAGELEETTPTFPDAEFDQLARALEAMRVEVRESRRQLEARVGQRTQELAVAFEFSQEITAQLELDRLLASVTERARILMDGRAAALCLLDEAQAALQLAAGSGDGRADPEMRQPVTADLPSQVVGQGKTVVAETACASCGFLRGLKGGHCVATPLRAGEAVLGALCVVRPVTATFEAEEQAAFSLLANAAAVAIVNAQLVEAGRIQAEQTATQSERERLAGELHDNLAQTLSFMNLKAERLGDLIAAGAHGEAERELGQMRGATARAYAQVRAALTGLAVPTPEAASFAAQLAACVEEVRAATGLPVELMVNEDTAPALPAVVQQQALHIVREALVNVWRHAGAQQATVCVDRVENDTMITVSDDGCGFDPDTVDPAAHLGLVIMRARAERSGGALVVRSQPGAGTQVIARFGGRD